MAADLKARAALEAAALALCETQTQRRYGRACKCKAAGKTPCAGLLYDAAACGEALLRALPNGIVRLGSAKTGFDPDYKPTLRQVATAVREAARATAVVERPAMSERMRERIATVLESIARDGLQSPRDLDASRVTAVIKRLAVGRAASLARAEEFERLLSEYRRESSCVEGDKP